MRILMFTVLLLSGGMSAEVLAQAKMRVDKMVFQRLRNEGVAIPKDLDSRKFFEELDAKAAASGRKLSPDEFMAEMKKRGSVVDENFDSRKFFEQLDLSASSIPIDRASAPSQMPSLAQCKAGWSSDAPWDQTLFNRLCSKG